MQEFRWNFVTSTAFFNLHNINRELRVANFEEPWEDQAAASIFFLASSSRALLRRA